MIVHQDTKVYKSVQDCEIRAEVWWSTDQLDRLPVVFWIHGGALMVGSRKWINEWQLQQYISNGSVVVSADYRLAPESKLVAIIEDIQDAYKWVQTVCPEYYPVDPGRVAVIGHSAGGYLALMMGFCVIPRPKALVSFYGYGDIVGKWYSRPDPFYCLQPAVSYEQACAVVERKEISEASKDRYLFYLYCRQHGLWPKEVSGHDPYEEPEFFNAFCPLPNVTRDFPPTLLLHGDSDTDVPYQQSVLMAGALTQSKVEHEFITIPDGEHAFDEEMNNPLVNKAFQAVIDFLNKHLKPTTHSHVD